ncbi:hypothetical protein [Stenotrophomonas maltophilia]|uniref:hypothetical protein n=1 Tax=Stenotrophomonas maltophilia TaxID=40324 RepID=UPI0024027CFA|nr:hypothetical protein [Stenotrophomonas maltophilia]
MNVRTYVVSSRVEIDGLLADAQKGSKTVGEIEQWAVRSIQDPQLLRYCMDRAGQVLAT